MSREWVAISKEEYDRLTRAYKRVVSKSNNKFYTFRQNNSGGYFYENKEVAKYLIIQTPSVDEANRKMKYITRNWSDYCECCGTRWDELGYSDGTNEPTIYGESIYGELDKWSQGSTIVYFEDGAIERLRYPEEEEDE